VVCVKWADAKAFAAWHSQKTGKSYRLLSEAEREYVTRAGTTTRYFFSGDVRAAEGRVGRAVRGVLRGFLHAQGREVTLPVR
jgi:formylglycine-generating enzyme required for sulfatase activity